MATGTYGYLGDMLGTSTTPGIAVTYGSKISSDEIWDNGISWIKQSPVKATSPKPLTFLQQLRKEIDEWIHN